MGRGFHAFFIVRGLVEGERRWESIEDEVGAFK